MSRERQLKSINLDTETECPEIDFYELVNVAGSDGDGNDADKLHKIPLWCASPFRAHKDFVDEVTRLRQHGLNLLGIDLADSSKQIKNWRVSGLQIDGDHTLQQSRAKLVLSVYSDRTKKWTKIKTGQFAMYPETDDKSKYFDVDKATAIIEKVIAHCWDHLGGKYGDPDLDVEENPQLILFPDHELQEK